MTAVVRLALWVLALVVLMAATGRVPANASTADDEFHDCASAKGPGAGECQHYLRNPSGPTDDPCWCDRCRNGAPGQRHDGSTVPAGWNPTLFAGGGIDGDGELIALLPHRRAAAAEECGGFDRVGVPR